MKNLGIIDKAINLMAFFAGGMLVLTMLGVASDVVFRYFLNRPIAWMGEITEYILLYITFLGAAWLLRREGHVKVDMVLNNLNPRTRSLLNVITSIVGALACLALVWWGGVTTLDHFQRGQLFYKILEVPKFAIYIIIPVGSFFLFFQFLRRARGYLVSGKESRAKESELSVKTYT